MLNPEFVRAFWEEGAVLRLNLNEFLLIAGPWSAASEADAHIGSMEFFGSDLTWRRGAYVQRVNLESFRQLLETKLGEKRHVNGSFKSADRSAFEQAFQMIQGKIQREEIEKAVIVTSMKHSSPPGPGDRAHFLFHLAQLPIALHIYGFWTKDQGAIGATPELLLDWDNGLYQTMALAGTCPKSELHSRPPLLKDLKEMKEHQIVVEDLMQRLRPFGWMRIDPTVVLELPTMLHLKTPISITGCQKSAGELTRFLHPTAALGVAPRGYGHRWLRELPGQIDRGQFGGPVLFRFGNWARTLVAIRSLFWNEKGSSVWAGCGLVAASQVDREWHEAQTKLRSVFEMLAIN